MAGTWKWPGCVNEGDSTSMGWPNTSSIAKAGCSGLFVIEGAVTVCSSGQANVFIADLKNLRSSADSALSLNLHFARSI